MRHFSVFTAPFYAFFSRSLYIDVGRHWGAKTVGYLLVVLALLTMLTLFGLHSEFSEFSTKDAPALVEQIPPISISGGRVTADVEQPHFIWSSEPEELLAIIDTTGEIVTLEESPARLLLTSTQVLVKKNSNETRVYDLASISEFYLDGAMVERWIRLFGTWGIPLLFPVFVIGLGVYRVFQALFYSIFGVLIAKSLGCRLGYGGILRVTVVAMTPALVVEKLLGMVQVSFSFSWLFYFVLAIGYMAFALSSNREIDVEGDVVQGGL